MASDCEIDVAPPTSFNFDNPDNVNGTDQNVTSNDDNESNSTETTHRRQLACDRLFPNLESVLNKQNYNPVS